MKIITKQTKQKRWLTLLFLVFAVYMGYLIKGVFPLTTTPPADVYAIKASHKKVTLEPALTATEILDNPPQLFDDNQAAIEQYRKDLASLKK